VEPDTLTVWSSYFGTYPYPCFIRDGRFFTRRTGFQKTALPGEAGLPLVYTYKNHPKEAVKTLPFSVLKQNLSEQKFAALSVSASDEATGGATCGTTAEALRLFKDDKAKEQKDALIKKIDSMDRFVESKETRVSDFRKWAAAEISWLKQSAAENPALKSLALRFAGQLETLEKIYQEKKDAFKTTADSYRLSEEIIKLADSPLPPEKQEEACDKLGREIRTYGGRRDDLTAELYAAAKAVRASATATLASGELSPAETALTLKLRADCGARIRFREGHDGK
jgi:hypothetical protein